MPASPPKHLEASQAKKVQTPAHSLPPLTITANPSSDAQLLKHPGVSLDSPTVLVPVPPANLLLKNTWPCGMVSSQPPEGVMSLLRALLLPITLLPALGELTPLVSMLGRED